MTSVGVRKLRQRASELLRLVEQGETGGDHRPRSACRALGTPPGGRPARVGPWDETQSDILRLPSGRLVRGRGLRRRPAEGMAPEFGLYLLGRPPSSMGWSSRWVRWPDFWLPVDPADARDALVELWRRSEDERVEVACSGGRGRTGTAMACLAVLDGVPAADAVRYVRRHYHPQAVETPWQQRYVRRFEPGGRVPPTVS